jgi:hypothetical protein
MLNMTVGAVLAHKDKLNSPSDSPRRGEPSIEELTRMVFDGVAEATDGCTVEPDGVCPHGASSWLLELGMI